MDEVLPLKRSPGSETPRRAADRGRFRNTEILTFGRQRIGDVEVDFGWSIPHKAEARGFVDPD